MPVISVDIEADGPVPVLYSMIELGAVNVETGGTFFTQIRPISRQWDEKALAVSGHTREDCMKFTDPAIAMDDFYRWCKAQGPQVLFMSDNAGFDWQFVNYYFHKYKGSNPFGFSPMSLTWFARGLAKNDRDHSWKRLRVTKHTHNALDDARGNAQAYVRLMKMHELR